MSKPTTAQHFRVFQKEVMFYVEKWGLNQWEIAFSHKPLDNERASVSYNLCGRVCTFFLTSDWTDTVVPLTNASLKDSAKHEAIELLLAEEYAIGKARFTTEEEHLAAHHALVRQLEKLL